MDRTLTVSMPMDVASFRAAFREWLDGQEIPIPPRDAEAAFVVQRSWQKRLADAGWLGVDWPTEYGGRGLSAHHQRVVMEELIDARAPFPASVINLYVVGPTLLSHSSHAQKVRFVPRLAGADEVWCQCFSEPNAGSDLAALSTRARIDREEFVVDGQKIWTSQAQFADFGVMLARTEPGSVGHRGISYLVVDMKAPGVTVRPIKQISGDSEFNEVFFEGVRVPRDNLVGGLGDGWNVAMRTVASERSVIIAQRKGEAQVAFATIVSALRSAGRKPSRDLERRLGHAYAQLQVLDAQVRVMNGRMGAGEGLPGQESIDKLTLTEVEQEVFSLALDVLGPYRQVADATPLGLHGDKVIRDYFYARSRSISGGTTQIQRNIVAHRVLGLPRS